MHNYKRIVIVCALAMYACCAQAHAYTFKNHLNVPVTVSMEYVAKSGYETQTVAAGGEIKFEYKIGHLWAGLCLNRNNLRLTKEGGTTKEAPIIYVVQSVYNAFIDTMKRSGKITGQLGIFPFRISTVCESRKFDIIADDEGNPRAITVM